MSHPPALPLLDNLFKLINFFCHCFARGVGGLICSALIEEKALAGTAIGPEPTEARNQPPGILSLRPTLCLLPFLEEDNFVPPPCFVRWPQLPSHGSRCCHSRHKQSEYRAHPSTDCPLRNYASSVTLSRGRGGAGEIGKSVIAHRMRVLGPQPAQSYQSQQGSGGATCLKRDVRALSSNIHSY